MNYDENGGFFDHVPPPTAPAGTAGEYLTGTLPSSAGGIAGPIGLGFRTPCLVISPFSAGGYKYSGTLDHTSTLRLIESRFGVTVVEEAVLNALTGTLDVGLPYPLPTSNSMPSQETTPARPPVP